VNIGVHLCYCIYKEEKMIENHAAKIKESAEFVQSRCPEPVQALVAIVLGSGLGSLAEEIQNPTFIPYHEIPNFVVSTVQSHAGRLVIGQLQGVNIIAMQGRVHYYEGYEMSQITFPVRVLKALGVQTLILTNAAGGLNLNFKAGDLMGISDHIYMPGFAGINPLRGANDDDLGPRFPPMLDIYSPELLKIAQAEADKLGITFHQGVYCMLGGPHFETRAELRFLRGFADAVGMSTAPETIVAAHSGIKVLGISTVTNIATGENDSSANHEEVMEMGKTVGPRLANLIKNILPQVV
jgi:purine-nucleoside phosphorylase